MYTKQNQLLENLESEITFSDLAFDEIPNITTSQSFFFEQFAKFSTIQYTTTDYSFYRYWCIGYNLPNKSIKKIWSSIKLRSPFLQEILKEIDFSFFSNINLKKMKRKILFLNYWGWVKKLNKNILNSSIFLESIFFYRFKLFSKKLFFLKKLKSIEKKLFFEFLNNFYFFWSQINYFFQISSITDNFSLLVIKKKKFSWSLPATKKIIYLKNFTSIFSSFNLNFKFNSINLKFFFLLRDILFSSTDFINKKHYNFWLNLNLFLETLTPNPIKLIICLLYFFNFLSILNNLFLIFFSRLYNITNNNSCHYYFYIFIQLEPSSIIQKKANFFFWAKEWFIKSYSYNKKKKNKIFFFFFNNLSFYQTAPMRCFFIFITLNYLLLTEKFFNSFLKISNHLNFKFLLLKKFVTNFYYFKNISDLSNFSISSKNNDYISYKWLKLLFLLIPNINFFVPIAKTFIFSLSIISNYLLYFNKYYRLDSFTSLTHEFFYSYATVFNSIFFFWKLYFLCFINFSHFSLNLINFESFFFRKWSLFWINLKIVKNFQLFFTIFSNILKNYTFITPIKFFSKLKTSFWFDANYFTEELLHLSYEFIHTDFEKLQEVTWVKQLSELRLIKLTNFFKEMWEKNMDPGNIQYSPTFTQQHEFGLLLKWGLELEILRKTKYIIEQRFYGLFGYPIGENFFSKKLLFIYDFKKPKFNFYNLKNKFYKSYLWLNFSSFSEITRLALASALASYWIFYKFWWNQLDNFYTFLNIPDDEFKKKDIYNFFTLIYNWHFLINAYRKYYIKTGIKKKISFPKMINKKVFNWFILPINIFKKLENFWTSFNYFTFKFFWQTKKWIGKLYKDNDLYEYLYKIIFKFHNTISFPSTLTTNDFYLYDYLNYKFSLTLSNKYIFLSKKYFDDRMFFLNDFFLTIKNKIDYLALNILKSFFSIRVTPDINILRNSNTYIFNYFFFQKKVNHLLIDDNFFLIFQELQIIFQNYFSEFFYEKFEEFFIKIKPFKINKYWKKYKNSPTSIYSNLMSENFSSSFFSFLNKQFFNNKNFLPTDNFLYLLTVFEDSILNHKIFLLFYNNLLSNFLLNLNFRNLDQQFMNYGNLYNTNYSFLLVINYIVNLYLLSKKFWKIILSSFYNWLLSFFASLNYTFTFKKLFFTSFWQLHFISNLELLFLTFLTWFFSFLLKK